MPKNIFHISLFDFCSIFNSSIQFTNQKQLFLNVIILLAQKILKMVDVDIITNKYDLEELRIY